MRPKYGIRPALGNDYGDVARIKELESKFTLGNDFGDSGDGGKHVELGESREPLNLVCGLTHIDIPHK